MESFYDIIAAEEKQAARGLRTRDICFSCGINEQTSDEIGQGAPRVPWTRSRGFASVHPRRGKPKHPAACGRVVFAFPAALTSK